MLLVEADAASLLRLEDAADADLASALESSCLRADGNSLITLFLIYIKGDVSTMKANFIFTTQF